jgi:hypothetical protein
MNGGEVSPLWLRVVSVHVGMLSVRGGVRRPLRRDSTTAWWGANKRCGQVLTLDSPWGDASLCCLYEGVIVVGSLSLFFRGGRGRRHRKHAFLSWYCGSGGGRNLSLCWKGKGG